MANLNVIVAYRGDRLAELAGQASDSNSADDLSRLNQRIQQGNSILKAWAEGHGGRSIGQMGDGGVLEICADHLGELSQITNQYAQEVGSTVSVGVGTELREANKALEYAVLAGGGNSIELYTKELEQSLEELRQPENEVNIFNSYFDKAEGGGAFKDRGDGAGIESRKGSGKEHPHFGPPKGSEKPEEPEVQKDDASPGAPPDMGQQFGALADQSTTAENDQKAQQSQEQQQGEETDNTRSAIVDVLKQFKAQAPLWEQLKDSQPDAYKTLTGVIQAMIVLAKQVYGGDEQQGEQEVKKAELPLKPLATPAIAPAMHNTVEGFMGNLKSLPKVGPERGKLITSHMNHAPFLSALQSHPQGPQVHSMLTAFLNSKANAGVGVGAKVMAKAMIQGLKGIHLRAAGLGKAGLPMAGVHHALDAGTTGRHQVVLPVNSQLDPSPSATRNVGRIKILDPNTQKTKWRSVRAGIVMAPDGTPTSSRNPSGGTGT